MERVNVQDFGACNDGSKLTTKEIQEAIDYAYSNEIGEVYIPSGKYLVSSIFLKSNVNLFLEEGAVLLGTTVETEYPIKNTRVAGIEMDWYLGIINIVDSENVKICGTGTIDGQGEYWWNKYWGVDKKGGMRAEYEKQDLRWAVDYDCKRIRNVVVFNSKNIFLSEFNSYASGFWNIHICYSEDIVVNKLCIDKNYGPSTDGIDIDSCSRVLVENCKISCNDDNICIKAGRDSDGLRVNRVCEDVHIRNCTILEGHGITLGSETSGGMKNISIENITYDGTSCGFRLKSARTRGGVIENINVTNLNLKNVREAFCFEFDWYPTYSYCEIPKGITGEIPKHWHTLIEKVDEVIGLPSAKQIQIDNVYGVARKLFQIDGLEDMPFDNFVFNNINIECDSLGEIKNAKNFKFSDMNIRLR